MSEDTVHRRIILIHHADALDSTARVAVRLEEWARERGVGEIEALPIRAGDVSVSAMQEVGGAVFAIPATGSVPDDLVEVWDTCDDLGLPRVIVLTEIDSAGADVEPLIEECQEAFGEMVPVLAVDLPVLSDDDRPIGLIDLLTGDIRDYSHAQPVVSAGEDRHRELVRDERSWLIEAIISETEDEDLVDAFLAGDSIDAHAVERDFYAAVSRGRLHPICLSASHPAGLGIDRLLDVVVHGFPAAAPPAP